MTEENDFFKVMWDQKAKGEIIKQNNPLVAVKELADISLLKDTLYNGVSIDEINGLVVTRSDTKVKSSFNATDGIRIQQNTGTVDAPVWTDKFFVDLNGILNLVDIIASGQISVGGIGNVNGVFRVKDALGVALGTLDKDGLLLIGGIIAGYNSTNGGSTSKSVINNQGLNLLVAASTAPEYNKGIKMTLGYYSTDPTLDNVQGMISCDSGSLVLSCPGVNRIIMGGLLRCSSGQSIPANTTIAFNQRWSGLQDQPSYPMIIEKLTTAGLEFVCTNTAGAATGTLTIADGGIIQQAWITPTMLNGWGLFRGGYYKDSLGIVHVSLGVANGTITYGTAIIILPAGYRPIDNMYFPMFSSTSGTISSASVVNGSCMVYPGGAVSFVSGSNGFCEINISFRAGL